MKNTRGLTLNELLDEVKRALSIKHWNYSYEPHDWFFPNDVIAHSSQFKYRCNKLYKAGLLDRRGDERDRWGYQYRVLIK